MSWRTLLAEPDQVVVAPWFGGPIVLWGTRRSQLRGPRPPDHGWHRFSVSGGRRATWVGAAPADPEGFFAGAPLVRGYLVGDRLLRDGVDYVPDPAAIVGQSEPVFLLEPGLERFARIAAARHDGSLVYVRQEFPLGPEPLVTEAWLDRRTSVDHVAGVSPALDLAFRFATWQRDEVARRRRLAEEARVAEQVRREVVGTLGDGASRRALARHDFEAAARAALAVGGAELLDWRPAHGSGERVVRFRHLGRRFECVCDGALRIVDAGVCLAGNDELFTLESLPGVIRQADDVDVLHIFRHAHDEEAP